MAKVSHLLMRCFKQSLWNPFLLVRSPWKIEMCKVYYMFKTCPKCGKVWDSQDVLLNEDELELIGYQAHFEELTSGLIMFNHSCGTTFSIEVELFSNLKSGPIFAKRAIGTDSCPSFCYQKNNLEPCPAKCECAYVRNILQIIKKRLSMNSQPIFKNKV